MSFCIIPQSPTLLRVAYQAMYCLEIRLRGGGLISIRDGAYSRFDRSNVVDEFYPTQGLKGFLSKYVDESAVYRRRSQSEDDNPPSPIAMEETQGGPASVGGSSPFLGGSLRAPQSPRDGGLRFAPPITPPTSSNPHTPASPHPITQVKSIAYDLVSFTNFFASESSKFRYDLTTGFAYASSITKCRNNAFVSFKSKSNGTFTRT